MTLQTSTTEAPVKVALVSTAAGDARGLTEAEAERRLAQYGENALAEHHVSVFERLIHFFWGPIPWMIEVAALLSAALSHWADLVIILAMLFINAGVGFWQEFKADNAIALLKQRLALKARVRRDGVWKDVEARLLVPGDIVHVKLGNIVPADMKLIGGAYLSVDQSGHRTLDQRTLKPRITAFASPCGKRDGEGQANRRSASMSQLDSMTASKATRYLLAVGVLGLISAVAGATSAQQSFTNATAGIAEADTAFHYADLAYDADDIVFARSSLQKAISCLVSPDDKSFSPAAGNPCAGQGRGAIRDINRAFLGWQLRRAVGEASRGLKRVEILSVRMDALSTMDYRQSVRQAWLLPVFSGGAGPAGDHSHAVVKLRRDEIDLSALSGAAVKNGEGGAIGTVTDMLIDRDRHIIRFIALQSKEGDNRTFAVHWSALKLISAGKPNAGAVFRLTTDALLAAPQFVDEIEAQPSYIDVKGNLVGRPVVAADGRTVGKLVGLVVERESGIVDYVLMSPNSVIGVTKSPLALPWKAIANLMIEHDVVLTLDEQQLAATPIFSSK